MSMGTRLPEISRQARNDGGDKLEMTAFNSSFRPERSEVEKSTADKCPWALGCRRFLDKLEMTTVTGLK